MLLRFARFVGVPMLLLCATSHAAPELVGSQGVMRFVYLPADELSEETLRLAAAEFCPGATAPICKISFWTDRALTPSKLPMRSEQSDAMLAQWQLNLNTGHRRWIWRCSAGDKLIAEAECF